MNIFLHRITEVENHIHQNDLSLGYRRLIDLILDLGEISFYRKIIAYSNLYYHEHTSDEIKKSEALQLLEELKYTPTPTYTEEKILIRTEQVEKAYQRRNFKLHPISFDLRSREVVGLVGENGNGKTTLLR